MKTPLIAAALLTLALAGCKPANTITMTNDNDVMSNEAAVRALDANTDDVAINAATGNAIDPDDQAKLGNAQ